jgi:diguanylate cyclase (GGDEF)-like protein
VSEQAVPQPSRPRVLLAGDASARPTGLERALTRAGFHLVEREDPGTDPQADAVLITLADIDEGSLVNLLPTPASSLDGAPPRIVLLSVANPDGMAAALALGAADALAAPVHLPELCARLHARIRERRQPGSAPGLPEPAAAPPVLMPSTSNGREVATPPGGSELVVDALDRKMKEEFERARRYSLSFSLILLGVDELRASEERLGAEAADHLRCQVSGLLRRELRVPDFVVPYGVDGFAIVLPETGQTGARQSLLRLRDRLTTLPFEGDPRLEPTRFSAGIVTYPHPAAFHTDDLFDMAEAALMRGRIQAGERIGVAT